MSMQTKNISRLVIVILALMCLGTLSELLLIGHYEDNWQLTPVGIIAITILLFFVLQLIRVPWLIKVFRILMIICILSGGLGVWFHLKANFEFETELHPSNSGWILIKESLSGAIPALAPGSMVALGLIGYLYTLTKSNNIN